MITAPEIGENARRRTRARDVLAREFANVLQELIIPQPILEGLDHAVINPDRTEQAARQQSIKKLLVRYDQIQARSETMYLDKLDGRITQDFFDKCLGTWRQEQDDLLRKIQDIQKATPAPIDRAVDMRLTSKRRIPAAARCGAAPVAADGGRKLRLARRQIADDPVRTV